MGYKAVLTVSVSALFLFSPVCASQKFETNRYSPFITLASLDLNALRSRDSLGFSGKSLSSSWAAASNGASFDLAASFQETGALVKPKRYQKQKSRDRRHKKNRIFRSLVATQKVTRTQLTHEEHSALLAALDHQSESVYRQGRKLMPLLATKIEPTRLKGEGRAAQNGYASDDSGESSKREMVVREIDGRLIATNMRAIRTSVSSVLSSGCGLKLGEFSKIDDPLRQAVGDDGCVNIRQVAAIPQISGSPWDTPVVLDLTGKSVAEAVGMLLVVPGYELLRSGPSVDSRTTRLLSLPVPQAHRILRSSSVKEALKLLAGSRIVIACDHSARLVAFDQSPIYANLSARGWRH